MPQITTPAITKSKKRSVNPPSFLLPIYNAVQRTGPSKTLDTRNCQYPRSTNCKTKNFCLASHSIVRSREYQFTSSWTGFNIQTRSDVTGHMHTVAYLPTINVPATDMSTMNEVLKQTNQIMDALQLGKIVCV